MKRRRTSYWFMPIKTLHQISLEVSLSWKSKLLNTYKRADQSPAMLLIDPATTMEDLPNDVLTRVFSLLDGPTIALLSCASSRLYSLSSDPTIWRHLCLSTWPSLNHPRVLSLSIPDIVLFADAFPFPSPSLAPHASSTINLPKELISAIDIYHNGQSIFSRVMETDTSSPWFLGTPFRLDALEQNAVVPATLPLEEVISPARLTLSWIMIDPIKCRSVNLSSRLPVSIDRHRYYNNSMHRLQINPLSFQIGTKLGFDYRYTADAQVRFGTVLGCFFISIVVTCSGKTGHVKEVCLTVEDEEGMSVSGEGSMVILTQAMDGERRNRGDEVAVVRRRYDDFAKGKKRRKESKARKEVLVDFCFSAAGAAIFLCLMVAVLFHWHLFHLELLELLRIQDQNH